MKKTISVGIAMLGIWTNTAFAVMCGGRDIPIGPMQSITNDCTVINQRAVDCARNPGTCGGTNPNIRGPVVTGIPLDAAYYAQQIQNAATAKYWDQYIRAQNAVMEKMRATMMRSRPQIDHEEVRRRQAEQAAEAARQAAANSEWRSDIIQTNSVVNVVNCGITRVPQFCRRLPGCGWSDRISRCIRDTNQD